MQCCINIILAASQRYRKKSNNTGPSKLIRLVICMAIIVSNQPYACRDVQVYRLCPQRCRLKRPIGLHGIEFFTSTMMQLLFCAKVASSTELCVTNFVNAKILIRTVKKKIKRDFYCIIARKCFVI